MHGALRRVAQFSASAESVGNTAERYKRRLKLSVALLALTTSAFAVGSARADEPPPPPPAEDTAPPADGQNLAPAEDEGVEKVVVTATRRETILQKTPVAVTVVNEKTVQAAEIETIEDLVAVVPSLMVTNNGNPFGYTARIRGVGTQGDNPGLEAAVGTFIDGVYRNRAGVAMSDFGEVERIEVLRGPQGTLFGRNTSAGIINVISKKPSFRNEVMAEGTVGSYDQFVGKGMANFVLAQDELAARVFFVRHEREGFIDVNPGRPDFYDGNATSYYSTKGQILWQAAPNVDVRIIGDFSERDDECCSAATVFKGGQGRMPTAMFPDTSAPAIINFLESPLSGKATSNQVEDQIAFGNRSTDGHVEERGVSGEVNWDIGTAKLTSITAQRDWRVAYAQDADFSGADIVYYPDDGSNYNKFETLTHETRITGNGGWVNWLIGVYYSDEDIRRRTTLKSGADEEAFLSLHRFGDSALAQRNNLTALFGHDALTPVYTPGEGQNDLFEQNARSLAFFTHNIVHLEDDLDLTLGLRYTNEEKTFDATYQTTGQNGCTSIEKSLGLDPSAQAASLGLSTNVRNLIGLTCWPYARRALDVLTTDFGGHHQRREESEFSGVTTLAWQVDESVNTYATYSRGHKAGGFNLDRIYSDANGSIVSPATCADPGPLTDAFACGQIVRAPDTSFAAEFVDAFEIGIKTSFDDSFFVNTAIFYQDFENFQLNTFTGISFIVTSVPEVISRGVEIETFWTPVRGLTTSFAVQYTDARYGDIDGFLASNPSLFLLKDATITHSPDWTLTGGLDYSVPFIDAYTARFHIDARWQSEMNTGSNLDPRKVQDDYAVVGLKLGVYGEGDWIGLEVFARNVLDERYINTAIDSPLQGSAVSPSSSGSSTIDAFLGEPRMIGATLRIRN